MAMRLLYFLPTLLLLLIKVPRSQSQYSEGTSIYDRTISSGKVDLNEQIQSHPDVNLLFYPERAQLYADSYIYNYPLKSEYRISLLMDPCRFNPFDCCMNNFGSPEYPALIRSNLEVERDFQFRVIASETEISSNYILVDEQSESISFTNSRLADDDELFNTTCVSLLDPYEYCQGRNYAKARAALRPPCMDNNQSMSGLDSCYAPTNGSLLEKCVQIAYSSNAFVPLCGTNHNGGEDDPHCGTYLEIHMDHGTPYQDELEIIAETKITTRQVSGFYTTVIPTTWMGDHKKVICNYGESTFRVGSLVYILDTAPQCCCPKLYDNRKGMFQCPIGVTGDGVFASNLQTRADEVQLNTAMTRYPYCHIDLSSPIDTMMISDYDVDDRKHFSRECGEVSKRDTNARSWTSDDLTGTDYDGRCPYFSSCALTLDLQNPCKNPDYRFTFIGRVGLVTAVDNEQVIPKVMVTFNNGRTSYEFEQQHVKLETASKTQYEVWWVVRTPSEFVVQKKKPFSVTSPTCTFDTDFNRYYPYAILDDNGNPLDTYAGARKT